MSSVAWYYILCSRLLFILITGNYVSFDLVTLGHSEQRFSRKHYTPSKYHIFVQQLRFISCTSWTW